MKKKLPFLYILTLLIVVSACGFKKINSLKQNLYFVNKIEINGEKKIGHSIKNEIFLSSSSDSEKPINIEINTKKKKEIKEKNIAGKISSYAVSLDVNLSIKSLKDGKKINNNFQKSGSYNVANSHSDTLANEKNTIKNLSEAITEDIINYLTIYLND